MLRQQLYRCAKIRSQHAILRQRFVALRPFSTEGQMQRLVTKEIDDLMDPEINEQQTQELLQRIEQQKEEIFKKTAGGRKLVNQISENIHVDQFEREQRYEIFINKMFQLYKYEKRVLKKQRAGFLKMATAPLMTETPVKLILAEYKNLSSQGFDGRIFSQTLEHLVQTVHARGQKPRVFSDLSLPELDTNWRMSKVAEDLKYALTSDTFFSSNLIAKSSRLLGELGYKNTEIIPLWFKKIESVLSYNENKQIRNIDTHDLFKTAIYGSSFNLKPRHYVYKGHLQDEEFQSHVKTLMEWKQDKQSLSYEKLSKDDDARELQIQMGNLIEQVKQIKGLAEEQQAAIASLRDQFFKLKDAQDKHAFLQANKYLRYDMLELQELLVKGGYIDPQEALTTGPKDKNERMARAADVFYDFVLNRHSELLSPQYDELYGAIKQRKPQIDIKEHQNYMNAYNYSSIIIGVAQQAQSFRRDVHGYDYPNKFYENLLMPPEYLTKSDKIHKHVRQAVEKTTPTNVLMERSYIQAWRDFYKLTEDLPRKLEGILHYHTGPRRIDSNIVALRALSDSKFSAQELRNKIYERIRQFKNEIKQIEESQVLIDGLMGIAHGSDRSDNSKDIAGLFLAQFDTSRIDKLKFSEKVELLNGICVSDLLNFKPTAEKARKVVQQVIISIDDIHFDVIDNELSYENFIKLLEVYQTIKLQDDGASPAVNFKNQNLLSSFQNHEVHLARYPESHAAHYDPLKPRLVSGLAAGLTQSDMEVLYESQQGQTLLDAFDGRNKFPYPPDILCGNRGAKVGVYLLNERETMRDSKLADGRVMHRLKLVQRAHQNDKKSSQILPVTIPVSEIIDYDLESFKLNLKPDFDISSFINDAYQQEQKVILHDIDTQPLAEVAAKLTQMKREDFEAGKTSGQFEKLIGQFYQLFESKRRLDLIYEPEQKAAAYDELKFHIMKLKLVYDALLSELEKEQLRACLPEGICFAGLIEIIKAQTIEAAQENLKHGNFRKQIIDNKFDQSWIGQRQMVELPQPQQQIEKKNIELELLNRSFLCVEDYHHYADWKATLEQTYDQFNLLQLPRDKNRISVYFDPVRFNRLIPYGIFPLPHYKRTPFQANTTNPLQISDNRTTADRFAEFEKDPIGYMREQELKKISQLQAITPDVSMICNLQNVKQGLKSELNDKQLADLIFNKLDLTNMLIKDHLKQLQDEPWTSDGTVKYVPRDPKAFRDFMSRNEKFKSPYNQFYLAEAVKQGFPQGLYEEYQAARRDPRLQDQAEKILEQLENALVNYKRKNEDFFNLSKALDNYLDVQVDIEALGMTEVRPQGDPIYDGLSDAQFLRKQRVLAETALIKSTIIYKCHNNIQLNTYEREYAQMWIKQSNESKSLVTGENSMVPESPSNLKIENLTPEDLYALNNLPGVLIERKKHSNFSVNDIVLEMSHLIDRDTVRKVELKMLEAKLKNEFKLSKAFSLVQSRNKEVDYLHQELEEISWRMASTLDTKDKAVLKEMFALGRGLDNFDKVFFDLDQQSFDAFFEEANTFDNRNTLIENWLCRKEDEYRNRVNLPTQALKKTDKALFNQYDAPRKNAREKLVGQMVVTTNNKNKNYSSLTTKELNMLVESLVVRLNLFNQKYPAFLPQVVKAIMEHPNLSNFDRANLDTYCTVFELDWRGDRSIENRDEFLMTNPVYMHKNDWLATETTHFDKFKDEEYIKNRVRNAHTPFLDELVQSLQKQASSWE